MLVLNIFIAAEILLILVHLIAYICYRMAFYSKNRESKPSEAYDLPSGEIYAPFREQMENWVREARSLPREEMQIRSFDGLTLRGRFYEFSPEAPIELMFPGYRGNAERDLSGGVQRCFALGHSALIVDQRAAGQSEGNIITFGILESRDCCISNLIELLVGYRRLFIFLSNFDF